MISAVMMSTRVNLVSLLQMLTYNGFYDSNLEFVGLEGVQIVGSMNAGSTLGRHKLNTRFTSVVRICSIGWVLYGFIYHSICL